MATLAVKGLMALKALQHVDVPLRIYSCSLMCAYVIGLNHLPCDIYTAVRCSHIKAAVRRSVQLPRWNHSSRVL